MLIEVKPSKQIKKPNKPRKKTAKALKGYETEYRTWLTNMHKFKAAEKVCKERGWKFKIVTETFFKSV